VKPAATRARPEPRGPGSITVRTGLARLARVARLAPIAALLAFPAIAVGAAGCRTLQAAAAKDPMRCERDPECLHRSKADDCPSQCVDDIECIKRCEMVRGHR
jgi:hypothetical protein